MVKEDTEREVGRWRVKEERKKRVGKMEEEGEEGGERGEGAREGGRENEEEAKEEQQV